MRNVQFVRGDVGGSSRQCAGRFPWLRELGGGNSPCRCNLFKIQRISKGQGCLIDRTQVLC
jgi:hypothetical protein